jgi:hypothetical protein
MEAHFIFCGHVKEHAPEPVICPRGDEVRTNGQLGAAEGRRDGVAAEGNRIFGRDRLFIADGKMVGQKCHIDIGLSDEQDLRHNRFNPLDLGEVPAREAQRYGTLCPSIASPQWTKLLEDD